MTYRNLPAPSAEPSPARRPLVSVRALIAGFFAASFLVILTACSHNVYQFPLNNFAGRPVPPSSLAERVMVAVTNGGAGSLQILDGLRDLRNNIQNTRPIFAISGYSGGDPTTIVSFPAELRGFVYSNSATTYPITPINYASESSGTALTVSGASASFAVSQAYLRVYNAEEQNGVLGIQDNSSNLAFALNLPNVYKVFSNNADTVTLAMTRNSNSLYRIVKLNIGQTNPPGAIDCEPNVLPVYCVVPVPGTFDRPYSVVFSSDGSTVFVLNCGVECGGGQNGGSGVSLIPEGLLNINVIPTATPYPAVVSQTIPIPGGSTAGITDGMNLYLSGQQLQPDGLFEGFLTILPLANLVPGPQIAISDGSHSKMLFADGPTIAGAVQTTLWVGSQQCSTGERAKLGLNYNCLTRVLLNGTTSPTATVVPLNVVPGNSSMTVPYPNQNENPYYYGSLTGLCWVQNYFKVYTAYGGQVHIFSTIDGSEINNVNVTVTGTALDVAYMDALTDEAN